jgi:predicted AlkP superfamily pyrophosphatase or phosphodiesterase
MVLLVSIDGLRPDAIKFSNAPNLKRLIEQGSSSLKAQTVMPCCTLPCHTSMLRGVDATRHGITTNTFHPLVRPVPSIIDVASNHELKVGFFYNWGPLRDLHDPESVQVSYYHRSHYQPLGDNRVSDQLIESHKQDKLDFAFLYLGNVDEIGHKHGWMSREYLEAVGNADLCVGKVIECCQPSSILVLSDHGGHDRTHGTECAEDMTIPWILWGENIKPGFTIEEQIVIFDTAPTLAHILKLPLPREWDGQIITSVFTS